MAGGPFAKFIVEVFTEYYQEPKEERKRLKKEKNSQPTNPYAHKWFGIIPSAIKQLRSSDKTEDKS